MLQSQFSLSVVVISASFRLSFGLRLNQGIVGFNSLASFYLNRFQKDIERTWNKLGFDLDARKEKSASEFSKAALENSEAVLLKSHLHDIIFYNVHFTLNYRGNSGDGGVSMTYSYNKLWKLLIDKNMMKKDLIAITKINSSTIAKMGRGEAVSLDVLGRICEKLDYNIGDLVDFVRHED